jgi:predicted lipoprotein with Yx(FWY)xxD motif
MKRTLVAGSLAIAAFGLAACGGTSNGSSSSPSGAAKAAMVSVQQVSGVGSVLADPSGKPLYTPVQEAHGRILCTGACTTIWQPLRAGTRAQMTATDAGKLGVVQRTNGIRQVTINGRPAYTFVQDKSGQVTGNGAKDAFGGRHFTWHVLLAGGKVAGSSGQSSSGSSGGGSSRGGYNYGY